MKLFVHDYAGHPFQMQLSRTLAKRGHEVTHLYATALQTPRGDLAPRADDAATLRIIPVEMAADYARYKYSFLRRRRMELAYGRRVADLIAAAKPEMVLSSNTPTETQEIIFREARRNGVKFYSWVQDFYSLAVEKLLQKKVPVVGKWVGAYYRWLEGRQLRGSEGIVAITEDFVPIMVRQFGVVAEKVTTIPNWAPLDSMPVHPKRNAWSEQHGLADKFVFLYTGTLGLKHNPELLLALARRHRDDPMVRVVVISEGLGADWLRAQTAHDPLPSLVQMSYQPFAILPQVLATGDVLLGVLEEEAGVFSVPSKILTYLCAQRPVLLAAPSINLATRMVARGRFGMTVPPDDVAGFMEAAEHLRTERGLTGVMGQRGRAFAEGAFQIADIADRFEAVLGVASAGSAEVNSPRVGGGRAALVA